MNLPHPSAPANPGSLAKRDARGFCEAAGQVERRANTPPFGAGRGVHNDKFDNTMLY